MSVITEEQGDRSALQAFHVLSNQEAESCGQIFISQGQAATTTVELSSGDSDGGEEDDEEEEERDSEATTKETGENSPWHRSNILRSMPDDDEADPRQEGEDPPVIPKKDMSMLISQGATPAHGLPEAASDPSGAPSSALGPLKAAPWTKRLSGFKLGKRSVAYAAIDQ